MLSRQGSCAITSALPPALSALRTSPGGGFGSFVHARASQKTFPRPHGAGSTAIANGSISPAASTIGWHCPAWHFPPRQSWPHAPQWCGSVAVSPHGVVDGGGHVATLASASAGRSSLPLSGGAASGGPD